MNILVTGGSGFIGRWVVKRLLDDDNRVWVLDDLSNGRAENLDEFRDDPNLDVTFGDIKNPALLSKLFKNNFDICIHLAASIIVQNSIDNPKKTFDNDVIGTFNVLEEAKKVPKTSGGVQVGSRRFAAYSNPTLVGPYSGRTWPRGRLDRWATDKR